MELRKIQDFVSQASDLHLAECRVNYDYSLLSPKSIESYKLYLFGVSLTPDVQVNKEKLIDLGHFFLNIRTIPLKIQSKVWDTHPGQYLVIAFIDKVTENITDLLKKWENCTSSHFRFFLIVFNKNLSLPAYENITVKKGKKNIKENFEIPELPWVSVIYDSFEIFKGKLPSFYLSDWEMMHKNYSITEGLLFFEDTSEVIVFQNMKKKEKRIDLTGLVVLDFFDESVAEASWSNEQLGKKVKYYKIFSGADQKNFRYTLGEQGLSHPTAEKLKIVDFPSTFVFCNQKLLWRGNKFYVDFNELVKSYEQGTEFNEIPWTESNIERAFHNIKNDLIENESLLMDVKIEVIATLNSRRIVQKCFRSKLVVCLEEESQKSKIDSIYNALKPILPNLTIEISERQSLFATAISSHEVPSRKKNEKALKPSNHYKNKIQNLKQTIQEQNEKIKSTEIKLCKQSETIEKQATYIQEFKNSNLGKLHSRVDKMIEEKTKLELDLDDKNKQIREMSQRLNTLKKDLEFNDSITEKRDGQLNTLLSKIKGQEQEIVKLNTELGRKTKSLVVLQGEITELRPSKEAVSMVERQAKLIEELKKQLANKDKEINVLKGLMKVNDYGHIEQILSSPNKLPKIIPNRSGGVKSAKAKAKFSSISNSVNYKHSKLDDNETESQENEIQRIKEEKRKIKVERKKKEIMEQERLRKVMEVEREQSEINCMDEEESRSREYGNFIKRLEKERREEEERKMKKLIEEKKKEKTAPPKGKAAAKPSPKVTKKK